MEAQDRKPSTVLVVRVPGDDSIVLRLRAELNSYRFRVVELPPGKRTEALSQLAEEREAQAALRAKPDAMAVEVWVRANNTGARTNEELVTAGPGRDPTVLAVRVTEAMRARGLVLPPLTASAAESGKRVGSANPPKPSADDDVEPARPTVLPPSAVRPSTPGKDPKRADSEQERKADDERKAEAEREQAERRVEAERKLDAERRAEAERKLDAERKAEAERKLEAERKAELARKAEAKRKADAQRQSESEAELARTAEAKREADRERAAEAEQARANATPAGATQARNALLYAEVGPSGVWSPGTNRLGPALDVFVSVRFRPNHTSSISLVGLIPLLSTDFKNSDGTSLEVQTFGIGGFGDLHLPLGPVELNVGIGGMAMLSTLQIANNPFNPNLESQRLAALLGRVGASISLTPDLRIGASIMVGLTVKDLRVQFLDMDRRTVTNEVRWGQPLLFGTLSLELALPWDR